MIFFLYILSLICSVIAFHTFKDERIKALLYIGVGVLLAIVAGLREGWADYDEYIKGYEAVTHGDEVTFEISFILLSKINKFLFGDVLGLFIIYAFLAIFLKLIGIKRISELWFLSLIIYLGNFYILHELIQMRVGVATGFLLLAIKPIYERNFKSFLFYFICAFSFHYSSLVILPLWFFNRELPKLVLASLIPLAYVVYFMGINLLIIAIPIPAVQTKIELYQSLQEMGINAEINVFNLVYLTKIALFYILLWKKDLISYHNQYANILMNIYVVSLSCFSAFAVMPVIGFRISELFGIVEIVLLPMIYYIINPKVVAIFIVVLIGWSLLSINILYSHLIY